jgi:hypothetical protein
MDAFPGWKNTLRRRAIFGSRSRGPARSHEVLALPHEAEPTEADDTAYPCSHECIPTTPKGRGRNPNHFTTFFGNRLGSCYSNGRARRNNCTPLQHPATATTTTKAIITVIFHSTQAGGTRTHAQREKGPSGSSLFILEEGDGQQGIIRRPLYISHPSFFPNHYHKCQLGDIVCT